MQTKQAAVLNTLTRVQRFLDANNDILGTINSSGYRTILDDVVTTLSGHAVTQTTSKRTGAAETAKERVLRNALKLNQMRPISAVAAAQLRQVPDFLALKMPPTNSTSRSLIAWAGAMGAAAANYASTFISAGLPSDFLAQLASAASTLSDAIASRGTSRTLLRGATIGLNAEATRGRQAVKVLDSLVEPQLAGNLSLLAQWNTAKRFTGRAAPITNTVVDAAAKGPTPAASTDSSSTATSTTANAPASTASTATPATTTATVAASPANVPAAPAASAP